MGIPPPFFFRRPPLFWTCSDTQISSSWVNIYTTYFLQVARVSDPFAYSILVTCTGLIGVLVSFFFVRLVDRRLVMLVGITACGICQLAPAIAWSVNPGSQTTANVVVAFIALFTFFYVAYGKQLSIRQLLEAESNLTLNT